MSEQEYHPSPEFNPGHPDNAAWRSGPKPPDMPAEAGIVAMFTNSNGPIQESDVQVPDPDSGSEKSTTPGTRGK
ncbi:hypothetical protein [Amycolatopsis sp. H20-H5]|uniref:hypothetical protein n=1 Tax=Amycolatopsis sp. H20-H5 TaxID=3046309 RepID=UPI002DB5710C|nr:hypothetical protein [Amycolatopsis sp. H20-H5]MEC3975076.1 hypothetical protein [Amycolatopsis sp. H20-H5]